jgi:periplasmic protein TonB
VAYRTDITNRDRGGVIAAVAAIHAALLFAVLHHWGSLNLQDARDAMKTFDVTQPPPPPPPPPPPQTEQARPKQKEGGSAPENIKSEATPIEAPKPKIVIPPVPQIAATETPRQATAPTQGASTVVGPGTGAGGTGTGTGSGAGGSGPGGGDNGVADPPHLVTPVLTGRDFPRDLLEQWPKGATVFLRLKVDARGYVSECMVDRRTGIAAIDSAVCNLAHDRLRFRPAVNSSGQAVAGWFGYAQRAPR